MSKFFKSLKLFNNNYICVVLPYIKLTCNAIPTTISQDNMRFDFSQLEKLKRRNTKFITYEFGRVDSLFTLDG